MHKGKRPENYQESDVLCLETDVNLRNTWQYSWDLLGHSYILNLRLTTSTLEMHIVPAIPLQAFSKHYTSVMLGMALSKVEWDPDQGQNRLGSSPGQDTNLK